MVWPFASRPATYENLEEGDKRSIHDVCKDTSWSQYTLLLLHVSTATILLLGIRALYLLETSLRMSASCRLDHLDISSSDTKLAYEISKNKDISFRDCGGSPDIARARGCRFELHNFAWVPSECYDEDLSQEWYDKYDWLMTRDRNGKQVITKEEAQKGDVAAVWVTWPQHVTHCGLVWRKYHRSIMFNRPMDNWTNSYFHTNHCGEMTVKWDFLKNSSSGLDVLHLKYPTCDYSWKAGTVGQINLNGNSGHHQHQHG
jgi:hypothetical protein